MTHYDSTDPDVRALSKLVHVEGVTTEADDLATAREVIGAGYRRVEDPEPRYIAKGKDVYDRHSVSDVYNGLAFRAYGSAPIADAAWLADVLNKDQGSVLPPDLLSIKSILRGALPSTVRGADIDIAARRIHDRLGEASNEAAYNNYVMKRYGPGSSPHQWIKKGYNDDRLAGDRQGGR